MKKFSLLSLLLLFLTSCSSSPYAGQWQAKTNNKTYDLNIKDDGTVSASWIGADGQPKVKEGTWQKNDDGSITLDGVNSKATANIENDRTLKFKGQRGQLIFIKNSAE
ncbi:MAG: hypothetical protein MK132_07590 [Lentisphaerales bacterium]|nr:hypothetical protein [Lentisphaerales bacterium]